MKVGAHPLVVAVALGLVGPQVLEEIDPAEDRANPCAGCPDVEPADGLGEAIATRLTDAADTTLHATTDWTNAPAPSAEDFARVALAFEKARNLV